MTRTHLFVCGDLQGRKDAFTIPLKFQVGIEDIVEFVKDKSGFLKGELSLQTMAGVRPGSLPIIAQQLIAAGLTIDKDTRGYLQAFVEKGVPVMLVSGPNCFVEAINYQFIDDQLKLTCKCKGKIKKFECQDNYLFCREVERSGSDLHSVIRGIICTDLASMGLNPDKGAFPVFKFSTFLDFIIWRSHFGSHLEKILVANGVKDELPKALERILRAKEALS